MNLRKRVPGIQKSAEQTLFTEIYEKKCWGGADSVSGAGSDYDQTEVIREFLPHLVKELGCNSILDLPCGDFFWMNLIDMDIDYVGGDVVPRIIRTNQRKYGNARRNFIDLDIIRDILPRADLILCRDCLVHFSDCHVFNSLKNIIVSESTFLLTTTFTKRQRNEDIPTGAWRPINLLLPPFNFPPPMKLIDERCPTGGYSDKHLGLWRIGDILISE